MHASTVRIYIKRMNTHAQVHLQTDACPVHSVCLHETLVQVQDGAKFMGVTKGHWQPSRRRGDRDQPEAKATGGNGNGPETGATGTMQRQKQREATGTEPKGGNGRQRERTRKRIGRGPAGGKSNGRQREATATEPKSRTQKPILIR